MTDNALAERRIDHDLADTIAVGKGGINFDNAGQVMEYAKLMAASGSAVPKHLRGQPGACLGVLDDAIRFGINPYALARKSYFVNDILAYEAQVFMAVINARAPLKTRPDIRFEGEGQEMRATVTGIFLDGAERVYISPKIADIQPRNSPLWKSDPGQQLAYYSLRAFARRWCPEVIMGIHDVDELRDAAMVDVTPPVEADRPAAKAIPRSLDEFAASAVASPSAPVAADATPTAVQEPQASAPAGAVNPPHAPADLHTELINRLMRLAAEDADTEARLESLQILKDGLDADERYPGEFVRAAIDTTAKVIRGELKPAAAKKYLESLK